MLNTALVFSATHLNLVQLDADKKQLTAVAAVPVASGAIVRGKVADIESLNQSFKELLAQVKLLPAKVVMVIPEDAVISKSIELPDLQNQEIDEAILWEAENYLPYSPSTAVLDWQRLPGKQVNHILFQAVPEDVVNSYLHLVEQVGIELTAVETPALAMVRLAQPKPGIRLLIHVSASEAILTLAKDQEVVATSVIPQTNDLGTIMGKTIRHMMTYYQKFPIEWIQIGGIGVTTQLVEALKPLKLPLAGFAMPFAIKPEVANSYLLAISAALKPALPPSDEQSINLLPEWYVDTRDKQKKIRFSKQLLLGVAAVLILMVVGLGGLYGLFITQEQSLKRQQSQATAVRKEAVDQATTANTLSKLAATLNTSDYFPVKTAAKIRGATGDQITLVKLQLTLPEKRGSVIGMAKDRPSLLLFKQELENLPELASVQLPASTFVDEGDIPFQLDFTITKDIDKEEKQ